MSQKQWHAEGGGEWGDGPEHPRQGSIQDRGASKTGGHPRQGGIQDRWHPKSEIKKFKCCVARRFFLL